MTDEQRKELDYELADVVTEKPHDFKIGQKQLRLYPVTLAKRFMLGRYMEALGIDTAVVSMNPHLEAMRLVHGNREVCCTILAIHATPNTYKDLYYRNGIAERRNLFLGANDEDLATVLMLALTADKTGVLMEHFGIRKERSRASEVIAIKRSRNSLSFGGKTIFGSFIAPLHELGYTDNEILYERSYAYLRMLLADKVTDIYLTDEELKKLPAELDSRVLDGNDPSAFGKLRDRLASRGVKFND